MHIIIIIIIALCPLRLTDYSITVYETASVRSATAKGHVGLGGEMAVATAAAGAGDGVVTGSRGVGSNE